MNIGGMCKRSFLYRVTKGRKLFVKGDENDLGVLVGQSGEVEEEVMWSPQENKREIVRSLCPILDKKQVNELMVLSDSTFQHEKNSVKNIWRHYYHQVVLNQMSW